MTAREARNRRRAIERKEAKEARKLAKAAETEIGFVLEPNAGFMLYESSNEAAGGGAPWAEPNPGFVSHRAEINRQNAQHSTGPRSPEGRLASSRNSLKHGLSTGQIIVPGEDSAAFESLRHALLQEHQPTNATEELLVVEMAQSYWLAQRAIRLQNDCFTENGVDEKRLALFLRYYTTHDRAFHKSLNTLLRIKQNRAREQAEASRLKQSRAREQAKSNSGFVSQPAPQSSPNGSGDPIKRAESTPPLIENLAAEAA